MKFKVSILNFLMLAALSFVPLHIAYSQTASILPPAKTTFFDKNGNPLASGTIDFYVPGTTTRKTTWQDSGQTIANTNPVVLDNAGRAIILGDGAYRQIVKDKYGNVIWDQQTSSTGSGSGGGGTPTVGDGDAVGTVKAWSGFKAPNQYVFAYGEELVRTSFPEAFQALTNQQNVSCTSGSTTLTGMSDTSQFVGGEPVESACLNAGTKIATIINNTSITVDTPAIINSTSTIRVFPYGNGDGTATFNVPDLRGRIIAGRDNMGGIAANRLTSTYFSGYSPSGLGANGGNESAALTTSNLPPYTPSGTVTNGAITTSLTGTFVVGNSSTGIQGGGTIANSVVGVGSIAASSSQAASTFSGVAQGGTSDPVGVIQPTQIQNYIIKVLPDTNPNSYFGVASIGGMTGVITCGSGVSCAGGEISAVASGIIAPTLADRGGIYLSSSPDAFTFVNGVDNSGNLTYSAIPTASASNAGGVLSSSSPSSYQFANGVNTSGNVTYAAIPYASASNAGGILQSTGSANQFVTGINTSGALQYSTIPIAQAAVIGGVFRSAAPANQFAVGIDAAGNILYGGGSTTVNGQVCTIGGSCTVTASAGTVTVGTTTVSSGTTNGLLYKDGSGLLASNTTANNNVVVTNGSGIPTVASTLPTANLPAFTGDVTSSAGSNSLSIGTNSIANTKLAQAAAVTLKGNPTNATANVQDFTIQGLTTATLNASNDYIPVYNAATGTIRKTTPSAIAASGSLPSIANGQVLANVSGSTAQPTGTTGTGWFDVAFCNTVGQIVARTTGGWVCTGKIPVNATWFGLSTAGTCSANATALGSANTAAVAAGAPIYIPSGNYSTNNVTISAQGLQGDGYNSSVLLACQATGNFITITGNNAVTRGMSFQALTVVKTAGAMLYVNGGGQTYSNFSIYSLGNATGSCYTGLLLDDINSSQFQLDNFKILNCSQEGIAVGSPSASQTGGALGWVSNGDIGMACSGAAYSTATGIAIYSSGGIVWSNVQTLCGKSGLITYPGTNSPIFGQTFVNFYADTTSSHTIAILTNGGYVTDFTINNSWACSSTGGNGIYISGNKISNIKVLGTTVCNNQLAGIDLDGGTSFGQIVLNDNSVCNNSVGGNNTYDGIYVNTNVWDYIINGNWIGNCGKPLILGWGNKQRYGINLPTSASDQYIITNNRTNGNVTGGINNAPGSNKVIANNVNN